MQLSDYSVRLRFEMKALAVLVLPLLLLAACDGSDPKDPGGDSAAVVSEDDGCSNATGVGSGELESPEDADVDGDGSDDRVGIVVDRGGEDGCQAFLVAQLDAGVASEPIWIIGREGGLPAPRINSFAEINGEPGLEVVVDEMAGASTQFVGAFTFVDGALERIEPAEPVADLWSGGSEGVFPYGGSVTHVEAVDCSDDGKMVVSVALLGQSRQDTERGIYEVTRRFFEMDGAKLIERDKTTEKLEFDFGGSFPEFGSSPFGSCPTS